MAPVILPSLVDKAAAVRRSEADIEAAVRRIRRIAKSRRPVRVEVPVGVHVAGSLLRMKTWLAHRSPHGNHELLVHTVVSFIAIHSIAGEVMHRSVSVMIGVGGIATVFELLSCFYVLREGWR